MSEQRLRIGENIYANALPIYFFFDEQQLADRVTLVKQVPAQLNKAMAKGELDVGMISSFSYGEHHQKYLLLPDLSISAKEQVRSIYLFSKRSLEELNGATIALTNTSGTSVNVLRIIFQTFLGFDVTYQNHPPVLAEMMEKADAALLIGDEAIVAYRENRRYYAYDLAQLWYQYTGYTITFAVWAVRREVAQERAALLDQVHRAFLASKERSLRELDRVVAYVQEKFGGDSAFWFTYFRGLQYDFTAEMRAGLQYYYALAKDVGLLTDDVQLALWSANSPASNTTML